MAPRKSANALIAKMDSFAKQLLERAGPPNVPPANGQANEAPSHPPAEVPLADQVSVFTAIQRWVQIKHKIDPDDESGDFISAARHALNGTAPRRRRGRKPAPEPDIESGDDDGELDPVL